jgi:valyl-tRNA synthetase
VPVKAHELADPEKGSGIAMICTFGDTTDVTWWRELDLPVRSIVGRDGRIVGEPPADVPDGDAWRALAGLTAKQAQAKIVELLRESGDLLGDPRPITHPVKFFEKGDRPLEIVTSRQWYVRSGGRDAEVRDALIARGKEIEWYPDFMRVRFEDWVNGLNGDWLISRQRYFGVPFPVWYRVGEDGETDHDSVLTPEEARLPVDPSTDVPEGFTEAQRGAPGGFVAEPDVMDTWATSSMSPQIASLWEEDDDLFARVFPMDLRPQAHDIIRTWLFVTVLRSHQLHDSVPWRRAAISGFISDPDRKKMSKSKGNAVTPIGLLEEFGSDGFRYWAASGRLGIDTAFDTAQMKVGRRLAVKILNASKFVLGLAGQDGAASEGAGEVTEAVDRAMLAQLAGVISEATAALDAYEHTRALERIETFFWGFCDDYLELVKNRAYRDPAVDLGAASARAALSEALSSLLRLFAPFLAYVTEEVWSWWQPGSVHRASWPEPWTGAADAGVLEAASEVLVAIRRAKTEAKLSMRAPVASATVTGNAERIAAVRAAEADLRESGNVGEFAYEPAADDQVMAVTIELATPEDTAASPP